MEVTPVGIGLAALGRPGYVNLDHDEDLGADRTVAALRAATHAVLDRAWQLGLRYFDAARSYGRAEEFLGGWLESRRPQGAVVGSKWGYTYTADWQVDAETHEVKDHSLATFQRQLTETQTHLGRELALYQIHSATLETGVLDDVAVRSALQQLADDGVVVGLTLSGPGQGATLARALDVAADGAPFRCVQATWNVLEPSVGPVLAQAHDAGWGVIVKEAVANGRLTARGAPPAALQDLADERGVGVDAIAIATALAQPFVDVVLSGAATVEQLDSNVAALDVEVSRDEVGALAELAEPPDDYWARRGAMPWT